MSDISQSKIQIGMTTLEDIREPSGNVILAKGEIIEDKHLRIFKIWGISEIKIETIPDAKEEKRDLEYSKKEIKEAKIIADNHFIHLNKKEKVIEQLYDIFVERHLASNHNS